MANFNTHLIVATSASGLAATGFLATDIVSPGEALICFSLGTVGGLLPDLDSDNSVLLKIIFNFLASLISFTVTFTQAPRLSIAELFVLWAGVFISINYVLFSVFKRFTVHRGIFHSIPLGLLFGTATVILGSEFFGFSDFLAWMSGLFMFLGYFIHLLLDEIYSVDLANSNIKRSFGTALKIADRQNIAGTLIVYLSIIIMAYYSPSPNKIVDTLFESKLYSKIQNNFLPPGKWFFEIDR